MLFVDNISLLSSSYLGKITGFHILFTNDGISKYCELVHGGSNMKALSLLFLFLLVSCGKNAEIKQDDFARLNKILGNKVTSSDDYASVVQIIFKTHQGQNFSSCSGTVICSGTKSCRSSKKVKTSAHCFLSEGNLTMMLQSISNEMAVSLAPPKMYGQTFAISKFAILAQAKRSLINHINQFYGDIVIRSQKNRKIREHKIASITMEPKWIDFYAALITASFMNDATLAAQLMSQSEVLAGQDQAYVELQKPISDVKIYPVASVQEVKDHLTEGQKITIAGWGINQDDFNFGVVPFGLNGAHPINNKRLETEVKVRLGLDQNNFFYVGEFKDWWFGINAYQNGACSGDSGGGAFMKINGQIKHIGTITSIQNGLCGTPIAVTPDGKEHHPTNQFHTRILAW